MAFFTRRFFLCCALSIVFVLVGLKFDMVPKLQAPRGSYESVHGKFLKADFESKLSLLQSSQNVTGYDKSSLWYADTNSSERFFQTDVEKEFNFNETANNIKKFCPGKTKALEALETRKSKLDQFVKYDNVVLIIAAFYVDFEEVFNLHELLYRHTFPKIVYCGPQKHPNLDKTFSFVFFRPITTAVELFYSCVDEVIEYYPGADGYYFISDDILFFHWNTDFSSESLKKVWYRADKEEATYDLRTNCHSEWGLKTLSNCGPATWGPIKKEKVRQDAKNALSQLRDSNIPVLNECFNTLAEVNGGDMRVKYQWMIADTFYIPGPSAREFQLLSRVFARNDLVHAMTIPTISRCLWKRTGFYALPGINGLNPEGKQARRDFPKTPWTVINKGIKNKKQHVHPYKLSSTLKPSAGILRDYFCDDLLPTFLLH